MLTANLIGTVGVAMLLLGFFLNLFGILATHGRSYAFLNAAGAGLSCYASYLIGFVPFVILEATWSAVAIVGLLRPSGRG
jgi:hypothetical protein